MVKKYGVVLFLSVLLGISQNTKVKLNWVLLRSSLADNSFIPATHRGHTTKPARMGEHNT